MIPDRSTPPSGPAGPEYPSTPSRPVAERRPEEEALLAKLGQTGPRGLEREARMYAQVLRVAADYSNPDWMACAAHNVRELMEKLTEKVAGVATPARRELRCEMNNFAKTWKECVPQPSEQPDVPNCRRLLGHARSVMDWYIKSYPSRRQHVERALVEGGVTQAFPSDYAPERFVDEWIELQDYFVDICHHNTDGDEAEFRQAMKRFADLALVMFARSPATPADLDRIDKFIAEHE